MGVRGSRGGGGEQERRPPCKDRAAFLCHSLLWEGCFNFRGFGEKGYGEGNKEIKWEGGRFAGTMKNHRHVCRLQQEAQQSRGAVPREILLPQPPWIEVEVVLLASTSCSPLFSDQRLVKQEGSHALSPAPRRSACGRKDGGGGLLGGPESPCPQLGWFEGESRALPFQPGQEEEKQASFAPQVLLNPPPFLCYHSAKPLVDAVFAAHRNGAGLPQERNNCCWDGQRASGSCPGLQPSREGSCLSLRWGGGLGVQRIAWGQTELSENWSCCTLCRLYLSASSAASQILAVFKASPRWQC